MILAVDFDNTISQANFPRIGPAFPGAIETLIDLQKAGHKIIIWTCRAGSTLKMAIDWLHKNGFTPDAVNENTYTGHNFGDEIICYPKIFADYYFDDRSFPPFPGWAAVRKAFLKG